MFSRKPATPVPAARSERLLVETVGDETVVYDLDTKDAHCLKAPAAAVFAYADGSRTLSQVTALVRERLGDQVTEDEVAAAVDQLESVSLLAQPPLLVLNEQISRRQMVRRVAYTGAATMTATTLITSIAAPSALAACTGQPAGCACAKNKECASNHCCGDQGNSGKCNAGCCADNNGNLCQCSGTPLACASPPNPTGGCCTGKCTPVNSPC